MLSQCGWARSPAPSGGAARTHRAHARRLPPPRGGARPGGFVGGGGGALRFSRRGGLSSKPSGPSRPQEKRLLPPPRPAALPVQLPPGKGAAGPPRVALPARCRRTALAGGAGRGRPAREASRGPRRFAGPPSAPPRPISARPPAPPLRPLPAPAAHLLRCRRCGGAREQRLPPPDALPPPPTPPGQRLHGRPLALRRALLGKSPRGAPAHSGHAAGEARSPRRDAPPRASGRKAGRAARSRDRPASCLAPGAKGCLGRPGNLRPPARRGCLERAHPPARAASAASASAPGLAERSGSRAPFAARELVSAGGSGEAGCHLASLRGCPERGPSSHAEALA